MDLEAPAVRVRPPAERVDEVLPAAFDGFFAPARGGGASSPGSASTIVLQSPSLYPLHPQKGPRPPDRRYIGREQLGQGFVFGGAAGKPSLSSSVV